MTERQADSCSYLKKHAVNWMRVACG